MSQNQASGYFFGTTAGGNKCEGETRTCVHCGFTWIYMAHDRQFSVVAPVKHTRRGYCLKCGGILCARDECLSKVPCPGGKPLRECVPY